MESAEHPQDYWDTNLDIQNLGSFFDPETIDLEKEIAFWNTPDQQWIYDRIGEVSGKYIVDIGGGLSVNSIILARKGARVVVVDISLQRLRILKRLVLKYGLEKKVLLICGEAEQLPLASGISDAVQTKSVLIHTNLEQTLHEIRRILKPGGSGFFVEPTTRNPFANLYRVLFAPREWRNITRYFNKDSISNVTTTFPDTRIQHFYLFGFLAFVWQFGVRNRALFTFSIKILCFFDNVLFRIVRPLKNLSWFIVMMSKK